MLAVWYWHVPPHQAPHRPAAQGTLTYILAPIAARQQERPQSVIRPAELRSAPITAIRLPQPARSVQQAQPAAGVPAEPPATVVPPTSAVAAMTLVTPPADPFALPAKTAPQEDALQRARRSAAAVDKQLRKEAWNPRDKKIANERTLLAETLASAYTGSDGMTQESVTLDDGRVMTRIRTGAGTTFCAVKESNGLTGGRDPFRDGIRTKVTTCGR